MARILVVEDDDGIRTMLGMALTDEGHDVTEAPSAEMALVRLGANTPELMLVDLMLGGMSGLDFIRQARKVTTAPILVVSALGDPSTTVEAFERGADDYVTKPFDLEVLSARCRAALRRASRSEDPQEAAQHQVLDADRCVVLDVPAGRLTMGDEEVHLTDTEFRLLAHLGTHPGRIVSREWLLREVWGHRLVVDDGRLVDAHMSRLRNKVERDPTRPTLITTVRGQGYRLDPQ
ncbi:DNA-binding response OmpR family regulator [Luteococcus japonicus]|uniref:DNA-binding response OmpR family regulator n=1 Tax=Luteococcus japonicus TaxID=33984 RepID=A0A3N1ZSU3_9ACTN|nr:response regulator transcription factor [Luteococcus japonicus]ROR53951.1 DNA-binding response OmpR family regulator [Luteococcus japonicus]